MDYTKQLDDPMLEREAELWARNLMEDFEKNLDDFEEITQESKAKVLASARKFIYECKDILG